MGRSRSADLVWQIGSRLPHGVREIVCRLGGWLVGWRRIAAVPAWEANVEILTGEPPTRRQRQELVTNWLRNNLMSLSLARWSHEDIMRRAVITPEDEAKLHESLAGPGCVLALPHMGSWDFAGAWCTQVGITVVSVAERLPDGLFERFRDARAGMGMEIYPVDQPDLMRALITRTRERRMVCLLSDRDLSGRGLPVLFAGRTIHVPAGPAMLARRTGAHLRVALLHFERGRIVMRVSDPIPPGTPQEMMTRAAAHFERAARAHPTSWLMLKRLA